MNTPCDMSDEEFVPFLHGLGVETYKKSFEWMLNDPDFAGVLQWLYLNLDHNNALTAREECRYAELEKKGFLLQPENLECAITSIQEQYQGICLPGNKEKLEEVKLDIGMQADKLHMLGRHEKIIKDLVRQNELVKEELNVEQTKLNSAQQQCIDDETAAAKECLTLEAKVETLTEDVIDVIAVTLELYGNCHIDKEIASKFLTFGPLEPYRQSQALFRSHFDLYTTKKFGKQNDSITDDDLQAALFEAKSLEDRLSDALCTYIESKAELCGEQAKLALVNNYTVVHPSQLTTLSMEAQTALDLLIQEESILDQQIQTAVKDLVNSRTKLAVETTTKAALAVREQIYADLTHLHSTCAHALSLDRLLYCALRHELRTVEQFAQFAAQLAHYAVAEGKATRDRIESMNEICTEQDACEQKLDTSDSLVGALCALLGVEPSSDVTWLAKRASELLSKIYELYGDVLDTYRRKEDDLNDFNESLQPLRNYIWDGCTKQPNCRNRPVASLAHALREGTEGVERRVLEVGSLFTAVKNGDKQNLRKLWQWFLTDQSKLMAAVKGIQGNSYT